MDRRVVAAIDIGESGGRVIAGLIEDGRVTLEPIHRFPNAVVELDGHLRWPITEMFGHVLVGLDALATKYPEVESIGIDTWAVDYGLLGPDGHLLAEPISYRDPRTEAAVKRVHARHPHAELFQTHGLQFLPSTTLYQLAAEEKGPMWMKARHLALVPDLISYWLTGTLRTEYTNATTTGLVDVRTGRWSLHLIDRFRVRPSMLPPLERPGATRGTLLPAIAARTGLRSSTVVTTVGSHDTASAIVGVPATEPAFAYIVSGTSVSGTSSSVGLELDAPVVTPEALAAGFTNEGGVDGRSRFTRNVDSLPAAYAHTVHRATELCGRAVDVIHVVGDGSQNAVLCQATATATGLPVVAGPVEATALGNVLVQARAVGAIEGTLEQLRAVAAASTELTRYEP